MKKNLFYSIMLFTVIAMLAVSCDKKNEPEQPSEQQEPEEQTQVIPVAAAMEYAFEVTEQMLQLADFTIEYYDKGELKTEKLTATKWSKFTMSPLPGKLGTRVVTTLKDGYNAADYESVECIKSFTYVAYCLDKDANPINREDPFTNYSKLPVPADKVPDYFAKDYYIQKLYSFDAEGNKEVLSEWE